MTYVNKEFEAFCNNIKISIDDVTKIKERYNRITKRINIDYWDSSSDTLHSLYVGSYGRDTEIFTSDIDILVQLPSSVYHRFNKYQGNGQSSLLQEVKKVLEKTYSVSSLKGDGQIIGLPFDDGINFEILPAFLNNDDKTFTYANSNDGGSWKTTDPRSEISAINDLNKKTGGNLKNLCRMVRAWKVYNNVDISGILIDKFAYSFLISGKYDGKSSYYYDEMSRDFFKYLSEVDPNKDYWQAMGSGRYIYRSGKFEAKAKKAYNLSLEAIENANKDYVFSAREKWREIYGTKFPK